MLILLKNKTLPVDAYEIHFDSLQWEHAFVPLMKHSPTDVKLGEYLESREFRDADAIIITSQRAIEIVNLEIPKISESARKALREKLSYTVGGATADVLRHSGYQDVRGAENAGNGGILADIMLSEPQKSYIFFTGKTRRDIIPTKLRENGMSITEKIVYETTELSDVSMRFTETFNEGITKGKPCVVFFSPSFIDDIVEILKKKDRASFFVASIGPTTERYLIEKGLYPDVVASKPSASNLADAVARLGVPEPAS